MPTTLVGRQTELAAGERLLASLTDGPAALVIEADAGFGKTALLDAIVEIGTRRGIKVLSNRPSEPEARLAMAGLVALLGGVDETLIRRLPAPQRHALDVALARADADPGGLDHRVLGVAVLSVLSSLAAEGPLVLAVDDAQWLDAASADALAFAFRRLRRDPVGVVAAHRSGLAGTFDAKLVFPADRVTTIELSGLSLGALRTLVAERLGVALDRTSLTKLERLTGGSPFLALEIVGYLKRRGREIRVDELAPVPADVRRLLDDRLATVPPGTRELLLVIAALGRPSVGILREAAAGIDLEAALAPAVDAGIAHVDGERVAFDHPLLASAAYASAAPARRRELHRSLAERLDDPDQAARHRALATDLPDAAVAAELETAADRVARRGAPAIAVDLLEHARRLTPADDRDDFARRALRLASHLWDLGDAERSWALAHEAEATMAPGPARAGAQLLLAAQAGWLEGVDASIAWAERALEGAGEDAALAATAHLRIVYNAGERDVDVAGRHLGAALSLVEDMSPGIERNDLFAAATLLGAELDLMAARAPDIAAIERARDLLPPRPDPIVPTLAFNARGVARERDWLVRERLDDLAGARESLLASIAWNQSIGLDRPLAVQLGDLAELETWMGLPAEAEAHATAAASFAEEAGATEVGLTFAHLAEAVVATNRGELGRAASAIEAGLARARSTDQAPLVDRLTAVRGSVTLAAGRPADAVADFGSVDRSLRSAGVEHPSTYRFAGDHAEALVLSGDLAAARALVDRLESAAAALRTPWLEVVAARSRALVAAAEGDLDAAERSIDAARAGAARLAMPVEIGRIDLLDGQIQRRRRRKRQADAAFRAALDRFESAGAAGWAERARRDLGRVGLRPRAPDSLTGTELEIARLAATGLTNRQMADALVLSPKTIDSALGRIYRKLGIGSRAELGAAMAAAEH